MEEKQNENGARAVANGAENKHFDGSRFDNPTSATNSILGLGSEFKFKHGTLRPSLFTTAIFEKLGGIKLEGAIGLAVWAFTLFWDGDKTRYKKLFSLASRGVDAYELEALMWAEEIGATEKDFECVLDDILAMQNAIKESSTEYTDPNGNGAGNE